MTEKTSRVHMRGFASLSPEVRSEIARRGGLAVPAEKRAFSKSKELAISAGRKGGSAERGKDNG